MLNSFAESHIGQRKINEDNYLIDDELDLYIVADGVGGMAKGEIASNLACEVISKSIKSGLGLKESVQIAHANILESIQQDQGKQGMATTIVAVLFMDDQYEIVWVGDSRAYIWDDGLKLITRDDSYVELLLEYGHIGIEELETHPDRNVISQALGVEGKDVCVHSNKGTLQDGQILLLCTDGLYNVADEMNIIESIEKTHNIKEITHSLVNKAVTKDGKDNITLLSILNSNDSSNSNNVIKPQVFREYDSKTGKVISFPSKDKSKELSGHVKEKAESENNRPTEPNNLTVNDRNRLDSAANQFTSHIQPSNPILPIVFGVILLSFIAILITYFQS